MKNKFFAAHTKNLKARTVWLKKIQTAKKLCAEKRMIMKIQSVNDQAFAAYGKVVKGFDFSSLLATLEANSEKPADSVIYVPSVDILEAESVFSEIRDNCYGGMPIQIGYCNGTNTKLNCFEYHRDSEDRYCRR